MGGVMRAALVGMVFTLAMSPAFSQQPFVYKCDKKGKPYFTTDERETWGLKCSQVTPATPKAANEAARKQMHEEHVLAVAQCMERSTESLLLGGARDKAYIAKSLVNNCGSAYRAFVNRETLMSDEQAATVLAAMADRQVESIRPVVLIPR
jgi:hypothetical protein